MNRRELLLQEMGIPLWELKNPEALQGVGNIQLPHHIHTLLLSDDPLIAQHTLVQDLIFAVAGSHDAFCHLTANKLARLDSQRPLFIFYTEDCQTAFIHSPFAQLPHQAILLPQNLQLTLEQKRHIWQQIQHYLTKQHDTL
ncbi:DNA polymerase III subunit psi [Gallibacterium trehalosifermentans]|uniref:DNA polymerase III subunit psi n=1 Tax=Gallibacterium trehalosifermentans TaxID=516935 RepID=A0ABV6H2G6_9PAST